MTPLIARTADARPARSIQRRCLSTNRAANIDTDRVSHFRERARRRNDQLFGLCFSHCLDVPSRLIADLSACLGNHHAPAILYRQQT